MNYRGNKHCCGNSIGPSFGAGALGGCGGAQRGGGMKQILMLLLGLLLGLAGGAGGAGQGGCGQGGCGGGGCCGGGNFGGRGGCSINFQMRGNILG